MPGCESNRLFVVFHQVIAQFSCIAWRGNACLQADMTAESEGQHTETPCSAFILQLWPLSSHSVSIAINDAGVSGWHGTHLLYMTQQAFRLLRRCLWLGKGISARPLRCCVMSDRPVSAVETCHDLVQGSRFPSGISSASLRSPNMLLLICLMETASIGMVWMAPTHWMSMAVQLNPGLWQLAYAWQ